MKQKYMMIGAALLTGVGLGVAGLDAFQRPTSSNVAQLSPSNAPQPSHAVRTGDDQHMTTSERPAFERRRAESTRVIIQTQNRFLTGDPNGSAEWSSLKLEGVNCGITPSGRYLIVKNPIGKTRYDENVGQGPTASFAYKWNDADCETSSPVNQARLIEKANARELYEATHPLDPECVLAQLKATATHAPLRGGNCRLSKADYDAKMRANATTQGRASQTGGTSPAGETP